MISAIADVINAALQPLTNSETWYGVWFALALRKEIYKTAHVGASKARELLVKRRSDGESDG